MITNISAFNECIDGLAVAKHPRICSLVSGIFNFSIDVSRGCDASPSFC